jgi:hypothetical protein
MCIVPVVARQWLSKHIPAATNTHNNRSIVGGVIYYTLHAITRESVCLYPPIVARQRLGKHVPAATKNCVRCCFMCGLCHIKGK